METNEVLEMLAQATKQNSEILDRLTKEKDGELHTKTPATAGNFTPLHGDGGIFHGPGLERDVITAHIRPMGLAGDLPLIPSVSEDPRFASLTGYTDVTGAEPTNACDDAPAGYVKGCNLTARFGMVRRDTKTVEMDKVMLKINRGDFTDLILRGRVLGLTGLEPSGLNEGQILDVVTMSEMVNVGVQTERVLVKQLWQGTYGTGTEFPGLDVQIATGQKDADTGTLCPALDSDVKDFNYDMVDGNGRDIVEYLSMLEFYLRNNAMKMGLDPVNWVIVMRNELWFELSSVWPCRYNTSRCSVIDTASVINPVPGLNAADMVGQRDRMRASMSIPINGNTYRVIVDDGIFEKTNITTGNLLPGQYASSIYMVPLTITGGFPVTYREYVDYRQAAADVNLLRGMEQFFWTDGGVFSWALEQIKWCYKLALKTEQRVILRTPQLAGRIDNVKYSPLQHLRDYDPDSPYFKDGGVSVRGGISSPYAVWTSRQ